MRFTLILILLSLLGIGKGYSQIDLLRFTDYDVAKPLINPAAMGLEPGVEGLLLYRSRFEKTDYWPGTGAVNINTMFEDKSIGGGVSMLFDKHGPYSRLYAYLAGVYRLKVNEGRFLYFGLQAGVNYVSNSGGYSLYHPEEYISADNYSQPNFGFGIHYKAANYYLGLAIPEFRYNTIDENGNKISNTMSDRLRMYLYGGYTFNLSENAKMTPLVYFNYSEESEMQMDVGAKISLKDNFEFGARYRTKEAFGVTARVRLFEHLWLGYSFETNNSDIDSSFNSVSEITLTFRMGKGATTADKGTAETIEDINSIRYF